MSVFLNKFKVKDIIRKVIIIHDMPDDFTTQPSGNSGTKIACGEKHFELIEDLDYDVCVDYDEFAYKHVHEN